MTNAHLSRANMSQQQKMLPAQGAETFWKLERTDRIWRSTTAQPRCQCRCQDSLPHCQSLAPVCGDWLSGAGPRWEPANECCSLGEAVKQCLCVETWKGVGSLNGVIVVGGKIHKELLCHSLLEHDGEVCRWDHYSGNNNEIRYREESQLLVR